MVLTVEPGCYFNAFLLEPALVDPSLEGFFVKSAIERCMQTGGVRLEDNIVITADGCYSLTDVPREIDDVEGVMAGAPWPRHQNDKKRKAGQ
jgi:Xaa-Pro dipeptidase